MCFFSLIHVTDWLPTFISAANGSSKNLPKIDGIDQWQALVVNKSSARSEMLYNIDPGNAFPGSFGPWVNGGIRVNEMKLMVGNPGMPDGRIPPSEVIYVYQTNREIRALNRLFASEDLGWNSVLLFNLTADPFEKTNVAAQHPKIVEELAQKLKDYEKTMIPPDNTPEIKAGNPNLHGGVYGPGWCTAQPNSMSLVCKNEKRTFTQLTKSFSALKTWSHSVVKLKNA